MRTFLVTLVLAIKYLTNSLCSFECGVRKLNFNSVIVRGQSTSPGEWPWHVAVYHRSGVSDSYACSGTLISEFYVLTADHCVKEDNGFVLSPRRIFVRVGIHNFQDPDPKTFQQHRIQKIHEFGGSSNLKNDIALLEMSTQVLLTNYVQPVCLNEEEDLTKQYGTAVGWGVTEYDEESLILKSSQMPVVSTVQCLESNDGIFRQVLDSSNFCAGYLNGTTVCNGDSGGGLHFERNGIWYVGGIISFTAPRDSSNRCHTKSYAGFTNVYRFISWIKAVTGLNQKNVAGKFAILPQDCGRYLVNRIVRGSTAKLNEFPWMALVIMKNASSEQISSSAFGSLIHKRYVLTTAEVRGRERFVTQNFVRLGEYNPRAEKCKTEYETVCDPPVQDIELESFTIHPEFNDYSLQNNIALIRLAKDAIFTDHIQPICLPTTKVAVSKYIIAGWGYGGYYGNFSDVLLKAIVPTADLSKCEVEVHREDTQFYVGEGVFCAGSEGTPNTCYGDHGTPLGYPIRYQAKTVRFVQYGITSATACGSAPSIYTDVAYYMGWILANLKH